MDLKRFQHRPIGRLVDLAGTDPLTGRPYRHKGYVPAELPESIELQRAAHNAIAEAMWAMGRLEEALKWVPNSMLYVRPAIRREAVSTSALEGTFATFEDVMGADVVMDKGPVDPNVAEVLNFVRAAEPALEMVKDQAITRSLICGLQQILVKDTTSDGPEAGQVRKTPVIIAPRGTPVDRARFVPPPPGDLLEAGLDDWVSWLEREDDIPLLARIAIAHYQFETLHPFTDGNGRIGRLVVLLQLVRSGLISFPMLNISSWLKDRREQYVDHLLEVSARGSFDPWIGFLCEAIKDESLAAVQRVAAAQKWYSETLARIAEHRVKAPAVHQIAGGLVGHPVLTPTWLQYHYKLSYPTANSAIKRLEALEVVREMTGKSYRRLYVATALLNIFNS